VKQKERFEKIRRENIERLELFDDEPEFPALIN